ncbi:hypothetical protein KORDIASMS9_00379 [Kordia sp. SMS9]|uniref:hypothetical protein n=1 Tax=Kordia sp. SMS9 TaxID=2282170 RepID=UPI000E10421F|nr:hypothetical protein [Kordia sp. SMS9]AXG68189.1 hypothetical protein KORDIASMS9_00379 [Kordia sp. SMS9]
MYLIWTIINYAFIILFFALILTMIAKYKTLLQKKYSIVIIVILVVGFVGLAGEKENSIRGEYTLPTDDESLGRIVDQKRILIEDNTLFDITMLVRFRKNNDEELIPVFTRSGLNGFTSDHRWNYDYAEIDKLGGNTYSYTVHGVLDWYFLDIKIYEEYKELTGTFTID